MTALDWSTVGKRIIETGVDRGVLYVGNSPGVVWPGLISVTESPEGGDVTRYYLDGVAFLMSATSTDFAGTINAYASPEEFDACEGIRSVDGMLVADQPKQLFGLSYRTKLGNDTKSLEYGYKLHLIYNALAGTPSKDYVSIAESTTALALAWDIKARPITIPGRRPTGHLIFDSTEVDPTKLSLLETILYGDSDSDPHLPSVAELSAIFDFTLPPADEDDLIYDGGNPDGVLDVLDAGGP